MRDKLSINKIYLVLIAGLVWVLAGSMVMAIGVPLFIKLIPVDWWLPLLAAIIFLIFYFPIFSKLVKKHVARIKNHPADRMPFWHFFDLNSYIVMVIMMGGGIILRTKRLMPELMIAFFYSGLGFALFSGGTRFISAFIRQAMASRNAEANL